MRQPIIHQMREKKKSSRKSQGSRKVTILDFFAIDCNCRLLAQTMPFYFIQGEQLTVVYLTSLSVNWIFLALVDL
jgi:hypothetical protein